MLPITPAATTDDDEEEEQRRTLYHQNQLYHLKKVREEHGQKDVEIAHLQDRVADVEREMRDAARQSEAMNALLLERIAEMEQSAADQFGVMEQVEGEAADLQALVAVLKDRAVASEEKLAARRLENEELAAELADRDMKLMEV